MASSASIHPVSAVYGKHCQSTFAAPLCHISSVDIWICHCVSRLQNVFIIGFYYKQRRLVLKNEVKKTTTRPWRPSGPKWTTHRVSAKHEHKGHIRIQGSGKQARHPTLEPLSGPPEGKSPLVNSADVALVWLKAASFCIIIIIFDSTHICTCANLAQRQTQTLLCGSSHPRFQSVFCGCCLCLYVSRGEGGNGNRKVSISYKYLQRHIWKYFGADK